MTVYFILAEREDFSRQFFFVTFMLYFFLLSFWRVTIHFIFRIAQKRGFNQRKVVIVGYGEVGRELHDFFKTSPELGILSLGFFDDQHKNNAVVGRLDQLEKYLVENRIDEVYCALPDVLPERIENLNSYCEQHLIKFNLIPDFRSFYYKRVQLNFFENIPILSTLSDPLSDPFNRIYKRSFDVAFSLLVIILFLSWFIPLIALIIKLGSKGPVFFVQYRPGFRNNKFKVYKFRSMVVNELSDDIQATKDDMRVTGIGKFLRKTSLDELPQFFNVLKGDMSVVGPRPHMLFQTELYSPMIDSYMLRHFVKPGITGLAQVNGYRGETSDPSLMKTRIRFDRIYIERWSPWLDLKIIILTALIAFKPQDYAY